MSQPRYLLVAAVLLLAGGPSTAGDTDHELARRFLAEGRIRPLNELIDGVRRFVPGELLKVEFEVEHGMYIYELKIQRPDARIQEIEVDAVTGKIMKVEDDD